MCEREGACSTYGREVDTADSDGYSPGRDTFADTETNGRLSDEFETSKDCAPKGREHATVSAYDRLPLCGVLSV